MKISSETIFDPSSIQNPMSIQKDLNKIQFIDISGVNMHERGNWNRSYGNLNIVILMASLSEFNQCCLMKLQEWMKR